MTRDGKTGTGVSLLGLLVPGGLRALGQGLSRKSVLAVYKYI